MYDLMKMREEKELLTLQTLTSGPEIAAQTILAPVAKGATAPPPVVVWDTPDDWLSNFLGEKDNALLQSATHAPEQQHAAHRAHRLRLPAGREEGDDRLVRPGPARVLRRQRVGHPVPHQLP